MVDWKRLYRIGGIAALMAVGVGLIETGIQFLPAARSANATTVVDWFTLFQDSPFMALRNLGLLNMLFKAMLAGLLSMVWYVLTALNLLRLGRGVSGDVESRSV